MGLLQSDTDSWFHKVFGYLKLLAPNSEGENTNVSVGNFGCGTELQLDHTSKM